MVRKYCDGDREIFGQMIFGLYEEDPEGEAMTNEKIDATIERAAAHPDNLEILMIEEGGAVAGCTIVAFYWSNEMGGLEVHIDELYVKKEFRDKGIGGEFMETIHERYPEAVAFALEVTPSNIRAKKMYQRLGFREAENTTMRRRKSEMPNLNKQDIKRVMADYREVIGDERILKQVEKEISEYACGKRKVFDVKLPEPEGTEFQKAVWNQLSKIPYGQVMSYGQVAEAIGRPGAVRAVGTACGANPYSVIVPCHRVLAKNGIGGFGLGLEIKRKLHTIEGIDGSRGACK